jgi:hypothetical protein
VSQSATLMGRGKREEGASLPAQPPIDVAPYLARVEELRERLARTGPVGASRR